MLTPEQAGEIKEQLIENIERNFPEEKREFAISQIESMNAEELEDFLKKNNIPIPDSGSVGSCIFCSIVSGNIPSYKIKENSEAVAVLEINPISKGHVLIIPKEHTPDYGKNPSNKTKDLIKIISKAVESKLKPKGMTIANSNLFGHQIINLIPNYKNKELLSPDGKRESAKPEELLEIQKLLEKEEEPKKIKEVKKKPTKKERTKKPEKESSWLPKRIP